MNDIQVADAGIQNYALDKCVMPADFDRRTEKPDGVAWMPDIMCVQSPQLWRPGLLVEIMVTAAK
jgi:hypothetical protein